MNELKDTRSRILDVAEELFSEQGFDRVSIRDITNKARVNLAAINYHFGSKEDLIAAIFEREFVPVIEALLKRQFEPLVERMDAALMKALPQLTRSDIFWCMKFTFGALHHWLLTKDRFRPAWLEKSEVEEQIQKLISFSAAGFRAA